MLRHGFCPGRSTEFGCGSSEPADHRGGTRLKRWPSFPRSDRNYYYFRQNYYFFYRVAAFLFLATSNFSSIGVNRQGTTLTTLLGGADFLCPRCDFRRAGRGGHAAITPSNVSRAATPAVLPGILCPSSSELVLDYSASPMRPPQRRLKFNAREVIDLSGFSGERAGDRTQDPVIKSHVLYRLSYALA